MILTLAGELESGKDAVAGFSLDGDEGYVRAKVIFSRESGDGFENFYCWTQPVFTDGRQHDHR